jgi:YesN/AraC family two-component response regulator
MLKGSVRYKCNENEVTANKGDLYFIQPGQRHEELSSTIPMSFIYLKLNLFSFRGEKINKLTEKEENQIIRSEQSVFLPLFTRIFKEMEFKNYGYKQIVDYNITEVLINLIRYLNIDVNFVASSYINRVVLKIIEEITSDISKNHTVKSLSLKYSISESYLSHVFKEVLNESVIHYINRLKIEESQRLLLLTDNTIYVIAEGLGFSTQYYFSKLFKKYIGICPTEYRKKGYLQDSIKENGSNQKENSNV